MSLFERVGDHQPDRLALVAHSVIPSPDHAKHLAGMPTPVWKR